MRNSFRRCTNYALCFIMFMLALSPVNGIGDDGSAKLAAMEAKITPDTPVAKEERVVFDKNNPRIQAVMAVQNRHTRGLMAIPQVVGTATGLTDDGLPAVLVFTKRTPPAGVIPVSLEGTPVLVKVTGEFSAMNLTAARAPGGTKLDPKARFERPVPIGVSTGNAGECSAGTIGARVKKGSDVYALSNNHVYALENDAPIGSEVLQPGRYDTQCIYDANNVIGNLSGFVTIKFNNAACDPNTNPAACNTVDAAIALSLTAKLDKSTPSNGYLTPNSTTCSNSSTCAVSIGLAVQKYGRTTSLTKGAISGINATVTVNYGASGTAVFIDQIFVSANKPFIKPGDSGSLMVTDDAGKFPVGLLFAGDSSGKFAVANQIEPVLNSFGVTIDGQ